MLEHVFERVETLFLQVLELRKLLAGELIIGADVHGGLPRSFQDDPFPFSDNMVGSDNRHRLST